MRNQQSQKLCPTDGGQKVWLSETDFHATWPHHAQTAGVPQSAGRKPAFLGNKSLYNGFRQRKSSTSESIKPPRRTAAASRYD